MQDFSDYLKALLDVSERSYGDSYAYAQYKAMIAKLQQAVQEYETLEDLKRDVEIIYMQSL